MAAIADKFVHMRFEIDPKKVAAVNAAEEKVFGLEKESRAARMELMEALNDIQFSYQVVRTESKPEDQ